MSAGGPGNGVASVRSERHGLGLSGEGHVLHLRACGTRCRGQVGPRGGGAPPIRVYVYGGRAEPRCFPSFPVGGCASSGGRPFSRKGGRATPDVRDSTGPPPRRCASRGMSHGGHGSGFRTGVRSPQRACGRGSPLSATHVMCAQRGGGGGVVLPLTSAAAAPWASLPCCCRRMPHTPSWRVAADVAAGSPSLASRPATSVWQGNASSVGLGPIPKAAHVARGPVAHVARRTHRGHIAWSTPPPPPPGATTPPVLTTPTEGLVWAGNVGWGGVPSNCCRLYPQLSSVSLQPLSVTLQLLSVTPPTVVGQPPTAVSYSPTVGLV